jgi:hypothetical protein
MTTHANLDAVRKTYHMEVGLVSYEHNYEELALAAQAYIEALEAAIAEFASHEQATGGAEAEA